MRTLFSLVLFCSLLAGQNYKYDLLLKGGHVIDMANNRNGIMDVAVADGKIAAVAPDIPAAGAFKVVNVAGHYVTPGLIDIHAHVTSGRPERPSFPADLNFSSGVTTIVDAGTHGADNFASFRKDIVNNSRIRVLGLINIVRAGMGDREQEPSLMDPKVCAEAILKNRDIAVGVKTAHYWTGQPWDKEHPPWAAVDGAVQCGKLANVPVMVDFWPRPERTYDELILKRMRPGDIHTHLFAQQFPLLDDQGKVQKFLLDARKRGVIFDVGHGAGSFWFRQAVPLMKQGFWPDSISTDLHSANWNGPVVNMITTMSKFLAMGMPVEEVIRRSTFNPARAIKRPELGTLTVGRDADIAVLELLKGKFGYTDSGRARFIGDSKLEARVTIRAGRIVFDATGVTMSPYDKAPQWYYRTPKLQGVDPGAIAEPDLPTRKPAAAKK